MVELAHGDPFPAWPLPGLRPWMNKARDFGAPRDDTPPRLHPGVDLVAPIGAVVVATEDGIVVGRQGWRGPRTEALVVQGDSGLVQVYGAVLPGTTPELGARVIKGEQLAEVGEYPRKPGKPKGASMLHFETWAEGTAAHEQWIEGQPAPAGLLDPRAYLAASGEVIVFPDDEPITPLPEPVPEPTPPGPTPEPLEPDAAPLPERASDGGLLVAVLLALVLFGGTLLLGGE